MVMASKAATWAAFGAIVKSWSQQTSRSTRSHPTLLYTDQTTAFQRGSSVCLGPARAFSTTRCTRQPQEGAKDKAQAQSKAAKRKTASTSLKRVALQAERSRTVVKGSGKRAHLDPDSELREVTAYCAAEKYNISIASDILRQEGYMLDPFHTDLYPQVLHVQTPKCVVKDSDTGENKEQGVGDVFVFASGSVVAWNVEEVVARKIVERWLPRAAENGHLGTLEQEELNYLEDSTKERSRIVGDTIVLGTKASGESNVNEDHAHHHEADTVLAKIAFSSALARSTKLAVLENLLADYFDTTRSIPTTLSHGRRLKFSRAFILKKTGELLSIRAQLNLYSELTDSLPDLFWDSDHELGLENYYQQVGRALDVAERIKILNSRLDYASEIAAVLRERLSEKHSTELEWLIIALIAIEVVMEGVKYAREWRHGGDPHSLEALHKAWLERKLAKKDGGVERRSMSGPGTT